MLLACLCTSTMYCLGVYITVNMFPRIRYCGLVDDTHAPSGMMRSEDINKQSKKCGFLFCVALAPYPFYECQG